jgi:capsular polysaccharide biosynthesis protein
LSVFEQNSSASHSGTDIDLRKFLKVIGKWRILIIVITLLSAIATGLVSYYMIAPVYQAQTLLMVTVASEKLQTQATISTQVNQNNQGTTATNRTPMPVLTMNTYLGQLKSEVVMKRVLDSNNLPGQTIGSLSSMINASIVQDSNLIAVTVQNTDPVLAAQIANAVSKQYLKLMDELMFSSVVVISPANVPVSPIKPNKNLNIEIALLLGLLLSILLAFLLEYLDNTLKTSEDIHRVLNLPVLGLIPAKSIKTVRKNAYGGNE